MRIGKIHTYVSRKIYAEDEIDRLNNKEECLNCKTNRIILCRINNSSVIMRVCQNKQCFHFTNINNLKSWIIPGQNK